MIYKYIKRKFVLILNKFFNSINNLLIFSNKLKFRDSHF